MIYARDVLKTTVKLVDIVNTQEEIDELYSIMYNFNYDIKNYFDFELCENFITALKDDYQYKSYRDASEGYKKVYCKIRYDYHFSDKFKNFLKKKISKSKYNYAMKYYNENNYSDAIDEFKNCIKDNYVTSDIKTDCKCMIVRSYYYYGRDEYYDSYYSYARELFEEALNILKGNSSVRNRTGLLSDVKDYLGMTFEKLGMDEWSNYNSSYMEKAMEYFNKAADLGYSIKTKINNCRLYYYLYKAYNESKSYRTSNLSNAKYYQESGIDVSYLYEKSSHISELEQNISNINNKISNLNYELNSINNDIKNKQSIIDIKNIAISNKNTDISSLVELTKSLSSQGSQINEQVETKIEEEKSKIENVQKNIDKKKEFIEEIQEFEKKKEEEIKNMKENNCKLKLQNENLILMLNNLEKKLLL